MSEDVRGVRFDAATTDPVDVLDSSSAGSRVIRGSLFRGLSYVAGVLLSVLAASLMIRHLGVTDWGRYVTVSSLVAVVTGLGEAGTSNIGIREFATLRAGRPPPAAPEPAWHPSHADTGGGRNRHPLRRSDRLPLGSRARDARRRGWPAPHRCAAGRVDPPHGDSAVRLGGLLDFVRQAVTVSPPSSRSSAPARVSCRFWPSRSPWESSSWH